MASYLVEGGPSKTFARIKALMHGEPAIWHELVERLTDLALASLRSQLDAGASAVQVFDSWAGILTPQHYRELVLPATTRLFAELADSHPGIPTILFGVGTGELLAPMATAGSSVVGIDWRVPLDEARRRVGPGVAVQGNLDPAMCLTTWEVAAAETPRGAQPGRRRTRAHLQPRPRRPPRDGPGHPRAGGRPGPRRGPGGSRGAPVSGPSGPPTGVLVMAHGTPSDPAGIEPFYTSIRRGRPPTPDLLAELVGRYGAIGETSPLAERTRAQVEGLAAALEAAAPGEYMVRYGAKHTSPAIEGGMAELVAAGVDRVVAIVLTPHQSSLGSGEYIRRAAEAASLAPRPVTLVPVTSWHRAPGLAALLAERTGEALASIDTAARTRTAVFFTAHSLPLRVVADGDPYPGQVGESASDIAGLLGLDGAPDVTWGVAWQSAGRTPDPWLGPDVLAELRRVAAEGASSVVVCPVGFVSDHLEILYDLDIEAADVARSVGVAFARTRSLNDDPRFLAILAGVVREAAEGSTPGPPGGAAVRTGSAPTA